MVSIIIVVLLWKSSFYSFFVLKINDLRFNYKTNKDCSHQKYFNISFFLDFDVEAFYNKKYRNRIGVR